MRVDEPRTNSCIYIIMEEEPAYQPTDAIQASIKSTVITGSAGLLFAAVQNTLTRQNIGALGVFTRFGGTIGLFGWSFSSFQDPRIADTNSSWGWRHLCVCEHGIGEFERKKGPLQSGTRGLLCRISHRSQEYARIHCAVREQSLKC